MLQVLPEWAPISQESVSSQNKYLPVFHHLSRFSFSLQTNVLQRPPSASVVSLLTGFAAAVKCQVKMPWKIYTAPQQKKRQEMVTCLDPDTGELTSHSLLIFESTGSEFLSWHQAHSTTDTGESSVHLSYQIPN